MDDFSQICLTGVASAKEEPIQLCALLQEEFSKLDT